MTRTHTNSDGHSSRLLIVDEEVRVLDHVGKKLSEIGYSVSTCPAWDEARRLLNDQGIRPDLIIIEPVATEGHYRYSLREICEEVQGIPVVVLSVSRELQNIVEAIRHGARDYLYKPCDIETLNRVIGVILDSSPKPGAESTQKVKEIDFVHSNLRMKRIHDTILQIADLKVPVLIHGESGVGKDLIARMIHQRSNLRDKPFVKVNCAALPSELVESELFGYRRGAFTGAHSDRPGKFEFANGGTIFLDEIGEFPISIQAKLLQVLQDGSFSRLGSNEETRIDVRVIAATNRNLEKAIREGSFRKDLYYRLNVISIEVPPLRERPDEIPRLCDHFLEQFSAQYNSTVKKLPEELDKLFRSFHWPGNIRELENLIKRYILLQDAEPIRTELEALMNRGIVEENTQTVQGYWQDDAEDLDLKVIGKKASAVAERNMILKTLQKTNWNRWKAAKELKISYKTLLTKIEQYQIKPSV